MGSQVESNADANAGPSFAEVNSRLDRLLRDVSVINSFNTIGALNALKGARTVRDGLKIAIAEVVMVYEHMIEEQPTVTYADQLKASWFVAGCSHRVTMLRTVWFRCATRLIRRHHLPSRALGCTWPVGLF